MENKKTRLIKEFFKFGVTGGLGTILNLLIFFLLVDRGKLPPTPVSVLCFIIAGTQNYVLNHLWSFREYTGTTRVSVQKWASFLAGSLFGLGVNILVMNFVRVRFNLPWIFIAQACGIAAGMFINFFVSKFIIFKRKPNVIAQTYIMFIVIAIALSFTSSYNPFNFSRMHVDSSIYVTIAKGITNGQLPYRDFVDNKGPLAYFLSIPGLMAGGFTGIWITEIIFLFISVLFAYKTALFFARGSAAFWGMLFSFVISLAFFFVNAGTEEYALPFLFISLYIFTKYYFSAEQSIRFIELVVLGICFTCAVLIRLNMFPLWAGFCFAILIETIIKRHFPQLGKYICGFCLGIAIVLVPVLLYLRSNGILAEFFNQVVEGGASRGFSGGGLKELAKNYYVVLYRNFSSIPLIAGLFWIIKGYRKPYFTFYAAYIFSYLLMVLFLSFSSGGSHYNLVLIPFIVPALVFFVDIVEKAFSGLKYNKALLVVFFCVIFSEGLAQYFFDLTKIFYNKSGKALIAAGKMIDENTDPNDTIISLGFNGYIYPFTQRRIASKYLYQGSGLNHVPNAVNEFVFDITSAKPAIIAVFTGENPNGQYMGEWHAPVYELIENEYRLLSDQNGFNLYIHKDKE